MAEKKRFKAQREFKKAIGEDENDYRVKGRRENNEGSRNRYRDFDADGGSRREERRSSKGGRFNRSEGRPTKDNRGGKPYNRNRKNNRYDEEI